MKIEILEELRQFSKIAEKEHKRGGSFRPFKYYKYEDGKNIPTYFIGSPGISVAIVTTLVVVATFYLVSLRFNIWIWLLYLLLTSFFIRLAMKIDKAKQIRSLAYSICNKAVTFLEEYNKDGKNNESYLKSAKELLEKACEWVDEPAFKRQIEIIDEVMK
ncbi:hypothetical protein DSN97_10355 [Deferribacteraceae bacterium V6Fe1]|nr:hypothetical protein DSN97_10355 [Deferribacteraceae bacterium V6Fe1]